MYIEVSGYLVTKEGQFLPMGERGAGGGRRNSLFLALTESFPTSSLSFAVFEHLLSSLLKLTASVNCCEA